MEECKGASQPLAPFAFVYPLGPGEAGSVPPTGSDG
jgi:hypothetical protein